MPRAWDRYLRPRIVGAVHLDDLEHCVIEGCYQTLREDWTDAFDQARAQIFCHAFNRSRRGDPQECSAKLVAVLPMGFPTSAGLNVFAGGHRGCRAQQRDEFMMPFNFDAQNAEAVIGL